MILVNDSKIGLRDFGIEVPLLPDRSGDVLASLLEEGFLNQHKDSWLLDWKIEIPSKRDLLRVHDEKFVNTILTSPKSEVISCYELVDKNGNPYRYSPTKDSLPLEKLVDDQLLEASGTIVAAREALKSGFCYYLGGGMHHAMSFAGRGFCLINDAVIAIRKFQSEKLIKTVWVIDVDAHKGDGTAELTCEDSSITTLSIHMAKGWPLDGSEFLMDGTRDPSWIESDIDIGIEEGGEGSYLSRLESGLGQLSKISGVESPDLVVVVNGSDPFEEDELPSTDLLNLTLDQMFERDMLVYNFLEELGVRHTWIMAGGYGRFCWKVHARFLTKILTDRIKGV